MEKEKRD